MLNRNRDVADDRRPSLNSLGRDPYRIAGREEGDKPCRRDDHHQSNEGPAGMRAPGERIEGEGTIDGEQDHGEALGESSGHDRQHAEHRDFHLESARRLMAQ